MSAPRRTRTVVWTIALAVTAFLLTAFAASPAAMASPAEDGGPLDVVIPVPAAPSVTQVSYGSPMWVFALVVVVTAVLTVAGALAARRFLAERGSLLIDA